MSRKTTAYSRKRRPGHVYNAAAWLNTIQRVQTFGEAPAMPILLTTADACMKAELLVRDALDGLLNHARPEDCDRAFNILAHALGVAVIRSLQIQPDEAANPALAILLEGNAALTRAIARFEASGAWGLDGAGREPLMAAVDVYADILRNSSPAQITKATDERLRILAGKTRQAA
ncbi:hypothetical protein P3G55_17365 [Leptospira sp. 96542]|nr:hypothetical protein [Leptospira sp. 96542]